METKTKPNLYQQVTDSIIELLESHQLSWDKPWISLNGRTTLAMNAETKRVYSLLNQILLARQCDIQGFISNSWLTFKQVARLGGSVVKDAKSSLIYFNTYIYFDESGKKYSLEELQQMSKEKEKQLGITSRYFLTSYRLFNLAQTKGLPEDYYKYLADDSDVVVFDTDQYAEQIIMATGATIKSNKGFDPAYVPSKDLIKMPTLTQFNSAYSYHETIFHELSHWTGHESRLARVGITASNKDNYAHEELIAELASAFICAKLAVSKTISNNAAYIQHWMSQMQQDSRYLMKVIYEAEKASKFILDFEKKEESK